VSFDLTDWVEIYGGLGYSIAEFDDFSNGDFDDTLPVSETNQPNFNGNSFPFAPVWSLNAGFDANHPSGIFGALM